MAESADVQMEVPKAPNASAGPNILPSMPAASTLTTFSKSLGTIIVDIYVGPNKKHFQVHKKRLCDRIPYFHSMFNGGFLEATDNAAKFPEDDPGAFDMLLGWVYSNNPRLIRELVVVETPEHEKVASWDAVAFYSLAEKFCLPHLQDIIMDVLIRFHKLQNQLPSVDFAIMAYNQTSTGSPISRYAARAIYFAVIAKGEESGWKSEDVEELFKDAPGFAGDYIKLQRKREDIVDPRSLPRCEFHTHQPGSQCPPPLPHNVKDNGKKKKRRKNRTNSISATPLAKRARVDSPSTIAASDGGAA